MKIKHRNCYKASRSVEYPPIPEQLDALLKLALHMSGQRDDLPTEVREWIAKCQEIKRKYPKPDPDNQPA